MGFARVALSLSLSSFVDASSVFQEQHWNGVGLNTSQQIMMPRSLRDESFLSVLTSATPLCKVPIYQIFLLSVRDPFSKA